MKVLSLVNVMICLVLASEAAFCNETVDGKAVYRKVLPSTAMIITEAGTGTGWVIDQEKRLLVTNYHVIAKKVVEKLANGRIHEQIEQVQEVTILFPVFSGGKAIQDRTFYKDNAKRLAIMGQVFFAEKKQDLAVIQVESLPDNAKALPVAATPPEPGSRVHSIGNPGASGGLWVYTSGTVRSVSKRKFSTAYGDHEFTAVETQSPINPGDSGGPVVNDAGEVVAVVQSTNLNGSLVSNCVSIAELQRLLSTYLPSERPLSAHDYFHHGHRAFDRSEWDAAIADYQRALKLDPTLSEVYHGIGAAYMEKREYAKAIASLTKYVELNPKLGKAYYLRGLSYAWSEDHVKAVADYNKAISLGLKTSDVYENRALSYFRTKRWDWAIKDYHRALAITPNRYSIYWSIGDANFNAMKRPEDAYWIHSMKAYQKFLQLAPASDVRTELAEEAIRDLIKWRDD